MKRLQSALLLLLLLFSIHAAGQTYYYEFTHQVDPNTGVRKSIPLVSPAYKSLVCITFTAGKKRCYQSYDNGNQMNSTDFNLFVGARDTGVYSLPHDRSNNIFEYQSYGNNVYTYANKVETWEMNGITRYGAFTYKKLRERYDYVTFSSDFNRINYHKGSTIYVGERKTKPGAAPPPSRMY